jgi:hypothetical protein
MCAHYWVCIERTGGTGRRIAELRETEDMCRQSPSAQPLVLPTAIRGAISTEATTPAHGHPVRRSIAGQSSDSGAARNPTNQSGERDQCQALSHQTRITGRSLQASPAPRPIPTRRTSGPSPKARPTPRPIPRRRKSGRSPQAKPTPRPIQTTKKSDRLDAASVDQLAAAALATTPVPASSADGSADAPERPMAQRTLPSVR